jgi:hypothetical protein
MAAQVLVHEPMVATNAPMKTAGPTRARHAARALADEPGWVASGAVGIILLDSRA